MSVKTIVLVIVAIFVGWLLMGGAEHFWNLSTRYIPTYDLRGEATIWPFKYMPYLYTSDGRVKHIPKRQKVVDEIVNLIDTEEEDINKAMLAEQDIPSQYEDIQGTLPMPYRGRGYRESVRGEVML